MRILKEIVFGRVKAYNLVEMFQFVVDKLEHYYQRRILSIAFDRYIQVRFRGLNCGKIQKENIKPNPEDNDQFFVKSRQDPNNHYCVDVKKVHVRVLLAKMVHHAPTNIGSSC